MSAPDNREQPGCLTPREIALIVSALALAYLVGAGWHWIVM